jgi:broad specificity phosphatase PhoE
MGRKTRINTIRHASTTFGDEHRYAGSIDVPLSERGIDEARAARRKLNGITFDAIITSPLRRTAETARLFNGNGTPIVTNDLCVERNFGILQGLTWREAKKIRPKILFIEVGGDTHSVNPPGGEPFEEVRARAKKFRNYIFKNYRGRSVLVVSHGVFLQQFHGLLRGLSCIESLAEYISNLTFTSFEISGRRLLRERSIQLLEYNTTAFERSGAPSAARPSSSSARIPDTPSGRSTRRSPF